MKGSHWTLWLTEKVLGREHDDFRAVSRITPNIGNYPSKAP